MEKRENLVLLGTMSFEKARLLQKILYDAEIPVFMQNIDMVHPSLSAGVKLLIVEGDKERTLTLLKEDSAYYELVSAIEAVPEGDATQPIKILVPIDFSDFSKKAAYLAFHIAEREKGEVVLLNVYFSANLPIGLPDIDTYSTGFNDEYLQIEQRKIIQEEGDKFTESLRIAIQEGALPDVPYSFELGMGIPEDEIVMWAKINKPQMIVMGTRGVSHKQHGIIGSVTANIIDRSPVPVMAIPENSSVFRLEDIDRIGFITNFDQRDLLAFEKLMRLPGFRSKAITFIFLVDKNKPDIGEVEAIRSYFDNKYPSLETNFEMVDTEELLSNTDQYIHENGLDILVLTTHKRSFIAKLFYPSIAHRMVFHSNTPLLTIRL